ncbi:uncharacterized protein C16orf52 homolog B-like isoform X2 [Nerophis ophidion]|uniref:uncharacterized protein C16orf52 homolog B-like isoform X2 n=1 Tax=Nerophis ophidion TaxID=159077 RepID=UPI002AE00174|nr:uncharacterized protein C16orf52 homolog B-like isoform X2 [Nerophis ophidion]
MSTAMDKLTVISGCLFLAAQVFAIASIANPDWISTGESAGSLTVGLVRQCQTIHGRDRTCIPPHMPPEWVTTLFFIILGVLSLTVTCCLLVMSHWRRDVIRYARWIAFTGYVKGRTCPCFVCICYTDYDNIQSEAKDKSAVAMWN